MSTCSLVFSDIRVLPRGESAGHSDGARPTGRQQQVQLQEVTFNQYRT